MYEGLNIPDLVETIKRHEERKRNQQMQYTGNGAINQQVKPAAGRGATNLSQCYDDEMIDYYTINLLHCSITASFDVLS